mgnify:CR=1 FL=1
MTKEKEILKKDMKSIMKKKKQKRGIEKGIGFY